MKILMLVQYKWPHIGGVEKHLQLITNNLELKGHKVKIISREDIKYPHIKYLGLLYIWLWLFKHRDVIVRCNLVHVHDVFIWYLPFRFLYPKKPVFTTFHGWEGIWPIPWKNIFVKRLAAKLSWGTITVGKYIEKYYGIKVNKIIYGGNSHLAGVKAHPRGVFVYVGRLDPDTGLLEFLEWLMANGQGSRVDFVGDGSLRKECEKYGKVHGFCDPKPFLKKADICVPGGYLSYIEALAAGCKIMTFADNPLKKDYWKEIKKVKKFPTWDEIADEYLSLYNSSK